MRSPAGAALAKAGAALERESTVNWSLAIRKPRNGKILVANCFQPEGVFPENLSAGSSTNGYNFAHSPGLRPRILMQRPLHMSILRLAVLLVATASIVIGPTCLWSQQTANPGVDAIFADLTKPGSPGCALGIFRDGRIIYAKGYGLANIEENVPISPETIFDIASISKQ